MVLLSQRNAIKSKNFACLDLGGILGLFLSFQLQQQFNAFSIFFIETLATLVLLE